MARPLLGFSGRLRLSQTQCFRLLDVNLAARLRSAAR